MLFRSFIFIQKDGVDVLNDEGSDLVVGPGTERKFKVSGKASADVAEYQSNKVEITKASPDNSWY